MPTFNMGETLNIDKGNLFVKLKAKGDKIKFRLVKGGYYDGKHFIKNDQGWTVSFCPRIMNEQPCPYCQKCSQIKAEALRIEDKKQREEVMKEAQKFQVKMTFYYPVIDRETGLGKILKTTLSIRQKLEEEFKNGVDVYEYDYVLTRTENNPTDYYSLVRMDSKQCKDLTDSEVLEQGKIGSMDLEEVITGVKQSSQDFKQEDRVEDIVIPDEPEQPKDDNLPF